MINMLLFLASVAWGIKIIFYNNKIIFVDLFDIINGNICLLYGSYTHLFNGFKLLNLKSQKNLLKQFEILSLSATYKINTMQANINKILKNNFKIIQFTKTPTEKCLNFCYEELILNGHIYKVNVMHLLLNNDNEINEIITSFNYNKEQFIEPVEVVNVIIIVKILDYQYVALKKSLNNEYIFPERIMNMYNIKISQEIININNIVNKIMLDEFGLFFKYIMCICFVVTDTRLIKKYITLKYDPRPNFIGGYEFRGIVKYINFDIFACYISLLLIILCYMLYF